MKQAQLLPSAACARAPPRSPAPALTQPPAPLLRRVVPLAPCTPSASLSTRKFDQGRFSGEDSSLGENQGGYGAQDPPRNPEFPRSACGQAHHNAPQPHRTHRQRTPASPAAHAGQSGNTPGPVAAPAASNPQNVCHPREKSLARKTAQAYSGAMEVSLTCAAARAMCSPVAAA